MLVSERSPSINCQPKQGCEVSGIPADRIEVKQRRSIGLIDLSPASILRGQRV